MDYGFLGNELTTPLFWDCECYFDYIKPCTVIHCECCDALKEDQPDSRVEEVIDTIERRLICQLETQ